MSSHSTVEAKNNLSALIDRALAGEEVVITRHGQPVVRLDPVRPAGRAPRRLTECDLAWLRAIRERAGGSTDGESAGELVRRMRDANRY
jgi:prevent-host-death family protein